MLDLLIELSGHLLVRLCGPRCKPPNPVPAPRGSLINPVCAGGPEGRRQYLARLRCPDGSVPTVRRLPCPGNNVCASFVELYEVSGGGETIQVYLDNGTAE